MNFTVSFVNDGLVDIEAITTFGVSSKEGDNPIGYFGTGFKYAIAVFLRAGCTVKLYRGEELYTFGVERKKIRADEFDVVTMNGESLGFTTQLGCNWAPWQGFRELWCNALDEGGYLCAGAAEIAADKTIVTVTGAVIHTTYIDRAHIVLLEEPWKTIEGVEIHRRPSAHMYYRGVRVGELTRPSLYTYNVVSDPLTLTEDRTLKSIWDWNWAVSKAAAAVDNARFARDWLTAASITYEGNTGLTTSNLGPVMREVLENLDFSLIRNPRVHELYERVFGYATKPTATETATSEAEVIDKSLRHLASMGILVTHPIEVVDDLPDSCLGLARDDTIFIARRTFMRGTKMVAGTIMEEHIHLHTGLADETRGLQDYLVDLAVTLGEKITQVTL